MSTVKVGLVAYSQGAPEVIVRMDKDAAGQLRDWFEAWCTDNPMKLLPMPVDRLLAHLRARELSSRTRDG